MPDLEWGPAARARWTASGLFAVGLIALVSVSPIASARAQTRSGRALRSIEVEESESGWTFELQLDFPVRYLRHAPQTAARTLRVQVAPVERGGDELPDESQRESLPLPRNGSGPLLEVLYIGSPESGAFIELQFSQSLAFSVEQGSGLRSLRIRADLPAARTSAESDPHVSGLLVRARHAIRDGDLDLAIALLTRVLEMPADGLPLEQRMDARELLGVTHERRGQNTHAMDQYEAYLADHPQGPAATRVRQRLEALRTASDAPSAARRRSTRPALGQPEGTMTREAFGSVGTRYYRSEVREDQTGERFTASDLLADTNVTGILDAERWALRGDFIGLYDLDLADRGRSNDIRISRATAQVEDRVHGLEATFGRQRRSDSGVLGRFDGVHTAAKLGPNWGVSALAGLPVLQASDQVPDVNTWVFGSAVNFEDLWLQGLQGQLFVVGQQAYSMTDRSAVGSELRYASDKTYSFVYLDYDFVFQSLNTFLASTSWRPTVDTDLRAMIERRNGPILTLSTALQGQFVDDLDDLHQTFSESEIRDLALDRTAVSWSGTVGASHRLSERYQVSGDLTVNHLSATDTSGGVEGFEAIGPDAGGTLQLLVSDWLVENGVGNVTVRYFEGELYRSFMTLLYSRFTYFQSLRASPRLRCEWRESTLQGSRTRLRPSFEVDWRRGPWLLNAEAGFQWDEPISGDGAARQLGFILEAGVRWTF